VLPVSFHFHIDEPTVWKGIARHLLVRGWCFFPETPPESLRLRTGTLVVQGRYGLSRPDVLTEFPEAPHASIGFEIRALLPAGPQILNFEAFFQGEWILIEARPVRTKRIALPFAWGGGSSQQLVAFQLPAFPQHPPMPISAPLPPTVTRELTEPALRISLVTPSFNQAKYLGACIQSVLESNHPNIQYVVQDGGSNDGSREIIQRHETRLHAWHSGPDLGQTDAINQGFQKTAGEPHDIMGWLNSDDLHRPGALSFVADYFATHPEVDVLYGDRILINHEGEEIGRWYLPSHSDTVLKLNDFVPQETLFWRRSLWDKVGGLSGEFKFAMDWDLLLRFQAAGARIVHVPEFFACFRIHDAQKTSAQMESIGQQEIDRLRERTFGREVPPKEIENHPAIIRYLRRSARREFLGRRLDRLKSSA
jgi:hypothetical protein